MNNTIFLRLEGPLQAWGDWEAKFLIRRTREAPTKSGVLGLICCAMGLSRAAAGKRLPDLADLSMAVRIDRPGVRWWDYHAVGAGIPKRTASGLAKKKEALLTRREYLCDASFLVVLQGNRHVISEIQSALLEPRWGLYLGRKACPPSRHIVESPSSGAYPDLLSAIRALPWLKRFGTDAVPTTVDCLVEWRAAQDEVVPPTAEIWYDVPRSFIPPSHTPRIVLRQKLYVGEGRDIPLGSRSLQQPALPAPRPRADYSNTAYRLAREKALGRDLHLCVFCKSPATTVQHITYRRAGGAEAEEDLRSLCRLCHDAVTMLEYGFNMGLDRINPEDQRWREEINKKRDEIVRSRSMQDRHRWLKIEER